MTAITVGELERIQLDAAQFLPDVATIRRPPSSAADGMGGQTETYATVASGVPCRLKYEQSRADTLGERGERTSVFATPVITFQATADVRLEDEIVVRSKIFRAKHLYDHSLLTIKRMSCAEI